MKKIGDADRGCDTCGKECGARDGFRPSEMKPPCFFWEGSMMLIEDERVEVPLFEIVSNPTSSIKHFPRLRAKMRRWLVADDEERE